jgi:phosphoserine phosphatase
MVRLIKKGVKGVRTLAVGDGANDVAMSKEMGNICAQCGLIVLHVF